MKRYLSYLKYVLRHKKYVFLAGIKLGTPIWQLIVHDWSKFLPHEFIPYAKHFYNTDGTSAKNIEDIAFKMAWNRHQKRNLHHWQAWVVLNDDGGIDALPMPLNYVKEMVSDWVGATLALGQSDIMGWYNRTKKHRILHESTLKHVEELLELYLYLCKK